MILRSLLDAELQSPATLESQFRSREVQCSLKVTWLNRAPQKKAQEQLRYSVNLSLTPWPSSWPYAGSQSPNLLALFLHLGYGTVMVLSSLSHPLEVTSLSLSQDGSWEKVSQI